VVVNNNYIPAGRDDQCPWLDDNGDGTGNYNLPIGGDGSLAASTYL